jgi:AcrR family transcriptional regulator
LLTGILVQVSSETTGSPPPRGPDPADPWALVQPESSRRLLEAAVEAFAAQGYHATTTRDIATRAGMSPAALYVHYPSKASLLGRISRVGHEAALALVRGSLEQDGDPLDRLQAVVRRFTAWHAEHHRVARIVQYELGSLPDSDRAVALQQRREIESLLVAEITRGMDEGLLEVTAPRPVARAILSLGVDVARWYDPAGKDSPAAIGALYADLAARMLGARR